MYTTLSVSHRPLLCVCHVPCSSKKTGDGSASAFMALDANTWNCMSMLFLLFLLLRPLLRVHSLINESIRHVRCAKYVFNMWIRRRRRRSSSSSSSMRSEEIKFVYILIWMFQNKIHSLTCDFVYNEIYSRAKDKIFFPSKNYWLDKRCEAHGVQHGH